MSRVPRSVVETLEEHTFRYSDEDGLQAAIYEALATSGIPAEREVRLNARDRIDLLVGTVGIEVKVASHPRTVLKQLNRYAASDQITSLVLVTTMARHRSLPRVLGTGIPLTIISLEGAGL